MAIKLSDPRTFRPVVTVVVVVIAPFFVAIIIATWSSGLVVGARRSRSGRGLVVWSTWSELGVARLAARRGSLDGSDSSMYSDFDVFHCTCCIVWMRPIGWSSRLMMAARLLPK